MVLERRSDPPWPRSSGLEACEWADEEESRIMAWREPSVRSGTPCCFEGQVGGGHDSGLPAAREEDAVGASPDGSLEEMCRVDGRSVTGGSPSRATNAAWSW